MLLGPPFLISHKLRVEGREKGDVRGSRDGTRWLPKDSIFKDRK
jgi:hypothetical protein